MFYSSCSRLALLLILLSSYSSLINASGTLKLHLRTWDYEMPACCKPGSNFSSHCDCYLFLKLCIGGIVANPRPPRLLFGP
ncbi:hypothetical protein L596_028152 [Steinernema carpocapsae]|uniref:Secreted protein n=1 Tax=Steinernema carpocapsae TaxID=34508 RepID=A0A4U5LXK6_STECR|nr:hypothetical protein L596_028152 [Steinernema carpocapsae]